MPMKTFDSRLLALAACPVLDIESKDGKPAGAIIFDPHPVITCTDDLVLTHEICHRLSGKQSYDIFLTALLVREKNELFKWVLNALYDWYDENCQRDTSTFVSTQLMLLREGYKLDQSKDPALNKLVHLLNNEVPLEEGVKILEHQVRDHLDLVVIADKLCEEIKEVPSKSACKFLAGSRPDMPVAGGGKGTCGGQLKNHPEKSNFYVKTVSKYALIIDKLMKMWVCNRYDWVKNYFGEINWSNLPLLVLGDEIGLPVFRIMSKVLLKRNVFLVIDRSGSTSGIADMIMETAVIITESLRRLNTPISILDVGVTNEIINDIDEPIDKEWFTPMSKDYTPLGKVILKINKSDPESLLIIITDGGPDSWEELHAGLNKFRGNYFTCVIGSAYREYQLRVKNVIPVEPNSIIRNLIAHDEQIISQNKRSVRG